MKCGQKCSPPLRAGILLLSFVGACFAQNPSSGSKAKPLAFDVFSIRPSKDSQRMSFGNSPDGYHTTGQSLWATIMIAFYPQGHEYWKSDRLLGAPSWMESANYDIEAKVSPSDIAAWQNQSSDKPMLKAMLQSALIERCNLVLHHTQKEIPGYALAVKGKGPKLTETNPSVPLPSGTVRIFPDGGGVIPSQRGSDNPHLTLVNVTMKDLAAWLSHSSDRPVEDKTGLSGRYDFALYRDTGNPEVSNNQGPPSYDIDDLGLTLKPTKALVDVLVIDHIDKPSAN